MEAEDMVEFTLSVLEEAEELDNAVELTEVEAVEL